MQSLLSYGRLISRVFANGLINISSQNAPSNSLSNCASVQESSNSPDYTNKLRLVTAVSGFSKSESIEKVERKPGKYGEDAYFIANHKLGDVLGVADGVGGWRAWGIDPGDFSHGLMRACERLVGAGRFNPRDPAGVIANAFRELLENKAHILGSSTVCVVSLQGSACRLHSANIGDSGFLVVRRGSVVHRSQEQQHYFNTPFQLSLPPPGIHQHVLSDTPESAERRSFAVQPGDLLLLATDGVFDNVPEPLLLQELLHAQGSSDGLLLQEVANCIALRARSLAFDQKFMSPFAVNARKNGINATGGKPDDITVILAAVID